MVNQEQRDAWKEVAEIWGNTAEGDKINFQFSELITELKDKMSQFEKRSIKSDLSKIKSSWNEESNKISQFEKDSITKDVLKITRLIKKALQIFKLKR